MGHYDSCYEASERIEAERERQHQLQMAGPSIKLLDTALADLKKVERLVKDVNREKLVDSINPDPYFNWCKDTIELLRLRIIMAFPEALL